MALKEKAGRERGSRRAYRRRRAPGGRRRRGLLVLVPLLMVLLIGAAYVGARPAMNAVDLALQANVEDDEAGVARVESPAIAAEVPEPVSEEAATDERAAEEEAAEAAQEEEAAAEQAAAERAAAERAAAERAAAERAAAERAADEEMAAQEMAARVLEAQQIAAQEEQEAAEAAAAEFAAQEEDAAAQAASETELAALEEQEAAAAELAAQQEAVVAEEEDETTAVAPDDPTMYLSVPKLGINGALVADGEAGLELGAMHQPGTGYPWIPGSNTYIAGHRVGFPGTGSDHIFYNLPSLASGDEIILTDSNGEAYRYQVSEVFAVTPFDLWVTSPTGADAVTLQVCTETPEDWWTIGPSLMSSGPESGRLIVRANRVT